jgi:hypothetical protein
LLWAGIKDLEVFENQSYYYFNNANLGQEKRWDLGRAWGFILLLEPFGLCSYRFDHCKAR